MISRDTDNRGRDFCIKISETFFIIYSDSTNFSTNSKSDNACRTFIHKLYYFITSYAHICTLLYLVTDIAASLGENTAQTQVPGQGTGQRQAASPSSSSQVLFGSDLSQLDKDLIFEGLKKLYKKKVR